jgi:hypothetical protein
MEPLGFSFSSSSSFSHPFFFEIPHFEDVRDLHFMQKYGAGLSLEEMEKQSENIYRKHYTKHSYTDYTWDPENLFWSNKDHNLFMDGMPYGVSFHSLRRQDFRSRTNDGCEYYQHMVTGVIYSFNNMDNTWKENGVLPPEMMEIMFPSNLPKLVNK